ncbi:MAG: hypothetical protein ACK52I_10750 [Pseudomonadota bacterium]
MKMKLLVTTFTIVTAMAGASSTAEAGKRHRVYIECEPLYCQPIHDGVLTSVYGTPEEHCIPCGSNLSLGAPMPDTVQKLEPLVVEETYTVTVPVTETIIGPDGKPRTLTKMVQQQRTRSRALTSETEIINELRRKLFELESKKVEPLQPLAKFVQQLIAPFQGTTGN